MKEKRCIFCKRIIAGGSKLAICPSCSDKAAQIGTGVFAAAITTLTVIGKIKKK